MLQLSGDNSFFTLMTSFLIAPSPIIGACTSLGGKNRELSVCQLEECIRGIMVQLHIFFIIVFPIGGHTFFAGLPSNGFVAADA